SYGATGLPAGLSIISSAALITGTLTSTLTTPANVTLTASNGSVTNSAAFTWSVVSLNLQVSDQSNLDGDSVSLALNGDYHGTGSLTYSITGLPPSVSLNVSTGLINGIPNY